MAAEDVIKMCVDEAALETASARRTQRRYPFFRPLTLVIGGADGAKCPAFSRDISSSGIGLLHRNPLEPNRIDVVIPTDVGKVEIGVDIAWCQAYSPQWHLSGGSFRDVLTFDALALMWSTISVESRRRLRHRYPFFRPISIAARGATQATIAALSRDISMDGIGLLHDVPIHLGPIVMTIPTRFGANEIRAEIMWCEGCGEGWYSSGARFLKLQFGELPQVLG